MTSGFSISLTKNMCIEGVLQYYVISAGFLEVYGFFFSCAREKIKPDQNCGFLGTLTSFCAEKF